MTKHRAMQGITTTCNFMLKFRKYFFQRKDVFESRAVSMEKRVRCMLKAIRPVLFWGRECWKLEERDLHLVEKTQKSMIRDTSDIELHPLGAHQQRSGH